MSALKNNEGFEKRQSAAMERPNGDPSPTLCLPFRSLPHLCLKRSGVETDATLTTQCEVTDPSEPTFPQAYSPFET
ncbi:hypothetical protein N7486_011009 [Penicillium sp. IBT 16267x]|nr:hypothetical protein N7486_011009 [Penicillium sp. IBT 16267x]